MNLYKYNKRTGYWDHQRQVTPETKDQWLKIHKEDEPSEHFHVSKNKPKHDPTKVAKEEFGGMVGGSPVTNNVGDGNIAGLGVGKQGEPGVNLKKKRNVMPFGMFVRTKPKN